MLKLKLKTWKEPEYEGRMPTGKEVDVSFATFLNNWLPGTMQEAKGMDNFAKMARIGEAIRTAEKTQVLELEPGDFRFIKEKIEGEVPSMSGWGKDLPGDILKFVNLEKESKK